MLGSWLLCQLLPIEARSSTPLTLTPSYLQSQGSGVCPSEDQLKTQRSNINKDVVDLIRQYVYVQSCDIGMTTDTAVGSCAEIPAICNSSMRYVTTADGKGAQVYCETNPPFDNGTWMQVANINMENAAQSCPSQWTEYIDSDNNIRACGRDLTQEQSVALVLFSTNGVSYSKVCGRITAYQFGATTAFTTNQNATLSDAYVDGVSITNGDYSEHIWTFAAARAQGDESSDAVCPCTNPTRHTGASIYIPSFVGNDYFCETGVSDSTAYDSTFYADYALWDGQDCFESSTCCQFNGPPWFCKTLSAPTTSDIAVRIMNFASEGQKLDGEDTVIQNFYLYIQ